MSASSNPQPALGAAIRALHIKKEAKQQAVAEAAGITVAHLSKIERGLTNPTWGAVVAIAEALDTSLLQLAKRYEAAKDSQRR
jgi:transcriptional regulator with XRE-family HTH domain